MDIVAAYFLTPILASKTTCMGAVVAAFRGKSTDARPVATAVTLEEIDAYNQIHHHHHHYGKYSDNQHKEPEKAKEDEQETQQEEEEAEDPWVT